MTDATQEPGLDAAGLEAARDYGLTRSFDQWRNMVPAAVSAGSQAQVEYALRDAKRDLAEFERVLKVLADPTAVHGNMLRGTIAKPSFDQIKHLYPEEFAILAYEAHRSGAEPVAWAVFAKNDFCRIWWQDKSRAEAWAKEHGEKVEPLFRRSGEAQPASPAEPGVNGNYGYAHDPADQVRDDREREARSALVPAPASMAESETARVPEDASGSEIAAKRQQSIREAGE